MTDKIPVAIAGATGAVGQRFIQFLAHHPTFEVTCLAASERSAGKRYRDATNWIIDAPMPDTIGDQQVVGLEAALRDEEVRVVFSALPGAQARDLEPRYAKAGKAVFTNASPHRMTPGVPLLIPEVNPDHLDMVREQATFQNGGYIVANGNCSGIILTLALAPLHRRYGLDTVHVTTLQGLSGAGYPGVSALDVVDNVVPYIGGEEDKLVEEPQKTLGTAGPNGIDAADFTVWPTCTRVPVREGHLESVHATLRNDADYDGIVAALRDFRGPSVIADLPFAPEVPIIVTEHEARPQPRRDRDNGAGMAVTVGRVRVDGTRQVRFIVLGHNTVRGAAGQSVLNAEYAHAKGLLA